MSSSDKLTPPSTLQQEQDETNPTTPDREATTPHSGAELTGPVAPRTGHDTAKRADVIDTTGPRNAGPDQHMANSDKKSLSAEFILEALSAAELIPAGFAAQTAAVFIGALCAASMSEHKLTSPGTLQQEQYPTGTAYYPTGVPPSATMFLCLPLRFKDQLMLMQVNKQRAQALLVGEYLRNAHTGYIREADVDQDLVGQREYAGRSHASRHAGPAALLLHLLRRHLFLRNTALAAFRQWRGVAQRKSGEHQGEVQAAAEPKSSSSNCIVARISRGPVGSAVLQAAFRRWDAQRKLEKSHRKEQTAATPEHATTSSSSGLATPPHTPTKGSSSRSASEPGSPAVSPPRPLAPVGSEPKSSSRAAARISSGPVPRMPTRNSRSSSGAGPPAPVEPESDADFHAALAALEDAPSSSICWSQPPHSAPEAARDDFGLAMATFRTLVAELMHTSAGLADTGETSDAAQLLREASPAGGFWGAAIDTQEAEQQPQAQQPGAERQPGVEQQPGTERQLERQPGETARKRPGNSQEAARNQPRGERQPEVEHQLGVEPRGRLWPTGESDTEEEDETAEWPAGRTAATFERHKRFADLDVGASRRQAL